MPFGAVLTSNTMKNVINNVHPVFPEFRQSIGRDIRHRSVDLPRTIRVIVIKRRRGWDIHAVCGEPIAMKRANVDHTNARLK
jgi:hypothetical protein